jgi:hypothetical protein
MQLDVLGIIGFTFTLTRHGRCHCSPGEGRIRCRVLAKKWRFGSWVKCAILLGKISPSLCHITHNFHRGIEQSEGSPLFSVAGVILFSIIQLKKPPPDLLPQFWSHADQPP